MNPKFLMELYEFIERKVADARIASYQKGFSDANERNQGVTKQAILDQDAQIEKMHNIIGEKNKEIEKLKTEVAKSLAALAEGIESRLPALKAPPVIKGTESSVQRDHRHEDTQSMFCRVNTHKS